MVCTCLTQTRVDNQHFYMMQHQNWVKTDFSCLKCLSWRGTWSMGWCYGWGRLAAVPQVSCRWQMLRDHCSSSLYSYLIYSFAFFEFSEVQLQYDINSHCINGLGLIKFCKSPAKGSRRKAEIIVTSKSSSADGQSILLR